MKNAIGTMLATGALLVAMSPTSNAFVVGFTPTSQSVHVGDNVSVDITVSDFSASESLGDYDFVFSFDNSILNLSSIMFGNELGFSDQGSVDLGSGDINLYGLSFEDAEFLESNQADSFTLATLSFGTLGLGISSLDISSTFAFGDQFGDPLRAELSSGAIEVLEGQSVGVPEPGALLLLSTGLAAMGFARRKAKMTSENR
jgi:hypothetical protein